MSWLHHVEAVIVGDLIKTPPLRPEATWSVEYAVWRLWKAKITSPDALFDHAVLTRQCLRWLVPQRVRGDRLTEDQIEDLAKVGVRLSLSGYLDVDPFKPAWLWEDGACNELDGVPEIAIRDEAFSAEEWLERTTGKRTWRSSAQKEACWTALTALPGETNLIGLPTGAGKSLVFQVGAAFSNGLMVVVVPTVALGLDQLAIANSLPTAAMLNPAAYSAEDGAEAVRDAVANRQCRLLFTSPEACVSGRLRSVLDKHANDGWLQWVVVDEAHIVESWGSDFRIEFQLLGALVRDWRRHSSNRLRTLLLSATFGATTQVLLRGLFVEHGGAWSARVVQRLRPEIHYHIQRAVTKDEQMAWVKDALLHLPRPLILYVTEKAEAKQWYDYAISIGLRRVECFHGDISGIGQRNRIMNLWRSDSIDLMVATSAFGMGVDKPDVRAVVHACFPESLDRFYQEVGRGGRDGASMQSVMIYTERDKRVGKGLAPRLLTSETLNDRWSALWGSRRLVDADAGIFEVNCAARKEEFVGIRTYAENVRWNKRLLQMIHRAGLLTVVGLHSERVEDGSDNFIEWVRIQEIRFSPLEANVGAKLSADRENELNNISRGFSALEKCAEGKPVCRELQSYYGAEVVRACGSCLACRRGGEPKRSCGLLEWPEDGMPSRPIVDVVPMRRINIGKGRADWIMAIRRTIDQKITDRFVVSNADFPAASSLFRDATGGPTLRRYRLDCVNDARVPPFSVGDRIVALHLSNFQSELTRINYFGARSTHWMPKDQIEDPTGRSRFTQENSARLFDSFETWLFERQPLMLN